jgi:hypothetical protein
VLDQVCGLDLTVRAAGQALKSDFRTIRRLLVGALVVATENEKTGAASPAA